MNIRESKLLSVIVMVIVLSPFQVFACTPAPIDQNWYSKRYELENTGVPAGVLVVKSGCNQDGRYCSAAIQNQSDKSLKIFLSPDFQSLDYSKNISFIELIGNKLLYDGRETGRYSETHSNRTSDDSRQPIHQNTNINYSAVSVSDYMIHYETGPTIGYGPNRPSDTQLPPPDRIYIDATIGDQKFRMVGSAIYERNTSYNPTAASGDPCAQMYKTSFSDSIFAIAHQHYWKITVLILVCVVVAIIFLVRKLFTSISKN